MNCSMKKQKILNFLKALILPIAVYLLMRLCTGGRFGSAASMMLLLRQSVIPILIALGLGFALMMGMWDFSSGAVVYAAAILSTVLSQRTGMGAIGMLIFAILISVLMTTITGLAYRLLKVPVIVVTCGMAMIYEGLPKLLGVPKAGIGLNEGYLFQAPWCFILLIIMCVAFYVLFYMLPFGHNIMAICGDQKTARNAGINIEKTKFLSFVVSGFFLGVAAALQMSNSFTLFAVTNFGSVATIFSAMMGIFVGMFLMRYCNFLFGIIIGTLTMQMLIFGLVSMGLNSTVRDIVQGVFLLAVLAFSSNQGKIDALRQKRRVIKLANEQYQTQHS